MVVGSGGERRQSSLSCMTHCAPAATARRSHIGHQLSLIEVGWITGSDGKQPFGWRGAVAVTGHKRPHSQVANSGRPLTGPCQEAIAFFRNPLSVASKSKHNPAATRLPADS